MRRPLVSVHFDTKKNCIAWEINYANISRMKVMPRLLGVLGFLISQIEDGAEVKAQIAKERK